MPPSERRRPRPRLRCPSRTEVGSPVHVNDITASPLPDVASEGGSRASPSTRESRSTFPGSVRFAAQRRSVRPWFHEDRLGFGVYKRKLVHVSIVVPSGIAIVTRLPVVALVLIRLAAGALHPIQLCCAPPIRPFIALLFSGCFCGESVSPCRGHWQRASESLLCGT